MDSREYALYKLDQVCTTAELKKTFTLDGKSVENDGEKIFMVGRLSDCDICLDSSDLPCFISRQHAKFTVTSSQIYVTDLKSVNGTFVNDIMLKPFAKTPLHVGETVMFGCVSLEAAIEPGSLVKQNDPLFKFELKKSEGPQDESSGQGTKAVDFEYLSICKSDCELDPKDATVRNDAKDEILPLTVKNLVAYAGCNFANISSDEKENLEGGKSNVEYKATRRSGGSSRKRRRTTVYSRKKGSKKDSTVCAFYDCKMSRSSDGDGVVSWVQCDYCNGWFHTDCIGCDYDTVKLAQNKFACGQC